MRKNKWRRSSLKFYCENHDFEEPNVQKLISILSVMQQILDIDNDDFIIDLSSVVKDKEKKRRRRKKKNKLSTEEIIIIIFNIGFGGFEKMMNDMVSDFEKDFFGNDDDDFFSGIDNFL